MFNVVESIVNKFLSPISILMGFPFLNFLNDIVERAHDGFNIRLDKRSGLEGMREDLVNRGRPAHFHSARIQCLGDLPWHHRAL